MEKFKYDPAKWLPFRDREACEKVRAIKNEDLCKHPNPNVKIRIVPTSEFWFRLVWDIFWRIKEAADERRELVLILPQPHPEYRLVADLINKFRVSCKKLYVFNMDEYANEKGHTPPEDWPWSFYRALLVNFYYRIDEDLRPPKNHMNSPTHENIDKYGEMIENLGGADVCYAPIGWSGHIAFIEPDQFEAPTLEEWKNLGPRIVDLSPFTTLQNSLFPDFGAAGDWSWIPPKAATIGPAQIVKSKLVSSWNGYFGEGWNVSWQKFIVRLAIHGPVTPKVPASILQTLRTDFYISEKLAENIEAKFDY
jgi:6-phosphogluconolactonase/glucosamine-6-phosphate isomerase/deaminase